jgi:hypothetical protein
MNDVIRGFAKELEQIIGDHEKFLCFTRGIEFQKTSVQELDAFMKKLLELKEKMIETKDEESANILLSFEFLLWTYIYEFKMWICLKEDKINDAWEALVQAESYLSSSFKASDIVVDFGAENYTAKLHLLEHLLFPPQTFTSITAVAEKAECSICGQEYGKCDHLIGKAYMGRFCSKIIKIKRFEGMSLLAGLDPGSKLCRVTSLLETEGWRDLMTWRIIKEENKNDKNAENQGTTIPQKEEKGNN